MFSKRTSHGQAGSSSGHTKTRERAVQKVSWHLWSTVESNWCGYSMSKSFAKLASVIRYSFLWAINGCANNWRTRHTTRKKKKNESFVQRGNEQSIQFGFDGGRRRWWVNRIWWAARNGIRTNRIKFKLNDSISVWINGDDDDDGEGEEEDDGGSDEARAAFWCVARARDTCLKWRRLIWNVLKWIETDEWQKRIKSSSPRTLLTWVLLLPLPLFSVGSIWRFILLFLLRSRCTYSTTFSRPYVALQYIANAGVVYYTPTQHSAKEWNVRALKQRGNEILKIEIENWKRFRRLPLPLRT